MQDRVSVPYRGATFLNKKKLEISVDFSRFPSPIGELHFSIDDKFVGVYVCMEFPSPIGELHFSILSCLFPFHFSNYLFPSPIGELHFSISLYLKSKKRSDLFPSPIGELHFSMRKKKALNRNLQNVSVPYRGATFLNYLYLFWLNFFEPLFPSPIGELHFSILIAFRLI